MVFVTSHVTGFNNQQITMHRVGRGEYLQSRGQLRRWVARPVAKTDNETKKVGGALGHIKSQYGFGD